LLRIPAKKGNKFSEMGDSLFRGSLPSLALKPDTSRLPASRRSLPHCMRDLVLGWWLTFTQAGLPPARIDKLVLAHLRMDTSTDKGSNKRSTFLLENFFHAPSDFYSTDVWDLSFLNRCPGVIWIVRLHLLGDFQGVRSEVFLKNLALLVDDKGHYSRLAPV
jgi:hypothetical protein